MRKKYAVSFICLSVSLAYAQGNLLDKLPSPEQIQRNDIERATGGYAPKLTRIHTIHNEKHKQEKVSAPQIIYQTQIHVNSNEFKMPNLNIVEGESLNKKKNNIASTQVAQNMNSKSSSSSTLHTSFYCEVMQPVITDIHPAYSEVACLVNNHVIKGEMKFVPRVRQYTLNANLVELQGYTVLSSKVYNGKETDTNVATYINKRVIENILLAAGQETGQQTSQMIQQQFENAGNTYTSSNGLTVMQSNPSLSLNQIPKAALYLGVANLIGAGSNALTNGKPLPPIFKVATGTDLYVRATIQSLQSY